jgi:hypothetical protein
MDEASTFLVATLPPMWRQMYAHCIEEGFTESQSLALVKTWIVSQGPKQISLGGE